MFKQCKVAERRFQIQHTHEYNRTPLTPDHHYTYRRHWWWLWNLTSHFLPLCCPCVAELWSRPTTCSVQCRLRVFSWSQHVCQCHSGPWCPPHHTATTTPRTTPPSTAWEIMFVNKELIISDDVQCQMFKLCFEMFWWLSGLRWWGMNGWLWPASSPPCPWLQHDL